MTKYNFEIHLTVECDTEEQYSLFKQVCNDIDAKPIAINLINSKQIMTSKTVNVTEFDLFHIIDVDKLNITKNGFKISRIKVESCPKYVLDNNAKYHYVEIHVPCHYDKIVDFNLNKLSRKWHRSFNLFKDNVVMLTCRQPTDKENHLIDYDIEKLKSLGFICDDFKHHYEYAVADSNVNLDKGWIN